MKRACIATALAALMIVPASTAAPLVDQIDNGGFEDFEDGEPAEWRVIDGEVERTQDAFEGDSAVLLNAVGDSTITTIGQNVSLEREDAPIVPNGTYDLDFAADLNDGTDTPSTTTPDATARVLWKNALGEVTRVDTVDIADSDGYATYNATFDAPIDATEAEVQFELERPSLTDRADANLKVDDVAFGPALPA